MKNHLLFLTILFLYSNILAQAPDTAWTKTFGSPGWDIGNSVCLTNDSGYVVAGAINSPHHKLWLIRTDNTGDTIWTKTYGDTLAGAHYIQQTTDGGFIVSGGVPVSNGFANWILKLNSFGDTLWTKTYEFIDRPITNDEDIEISTSVQQTFDGGYIITGPSEWDVNTGFDFLLIKTDPDGIIEWRKTFGGDSTEVSTFVRQTSDGGYIISGYSLESGEVTAVLLRTNSTGDSLWSATYTYETLNRDEIYCVKETADGGFIFTGTARPDIPDSRRVWLVKTDSQGVVDWEKIYGHGELTGAKDVIELPGEGYVIAAHLSKPDEMYEGWLIKTDMAGDTLWTYLLESDFRNEFRSVKLTNDGGYITTGYYEPTFENLDVLLVKFDPEPTSIKVLGNIHPSEFYLEQNYPNPFNPETTIQFSVPVKSDISIMLYNVLGDLLSVFLDEEKPAGNYEIKFNAGNLPSGVYFYKIISGSYSETKKMVLLR